MGLDGVEFVMATEEAFQIAIPDEAAEQALTPGAVVRYVLSRVGEQESNGCLEQRAFYRLRRAATQVFARPRSSVTTSTPWTEMLPPRQVRHNWRLLHQAAGTPYWPKLTLWGKVPNHVATVGDTARYLVAQVPGAFKRPGEGWTRLAVEDVIRRLMREQLGITEFEWEQEFGRDLGVE